LKLLEENEKSGQRHERSGDRQQQHHEPNSGRWRQRVEELETVEAYQRAHGTAQAVAEQRAARERIHVKKAVPLPSVMGT